MERGDDGDVVVVGVVVIVVVVCCEGATTESTESANTCRGTLLLLLLLMLSRFSLLLFSSLDALAAELAEEPHEEGVGWANGIGGDRVCWDGESLADKRTKDAEEAED